MPTRKKKLLCHCTSVWLFLPRNLKKRPKRIVKSPCFSFQTEITLWTNQMKSGHRRKFSYSSVALLYFFFEPNKPLVFHFVGHSKGPSLDNTSTPFDCYILVDLEQLFLTQTLIAVRSGSPRASVFTSGDTNFCACTWSSKDWRARARQILTHVRVLNIKA
jgi:hypothetical protein